MNASIRASGVVSAFFVAAFEELGGKELSKLVLYGCGVLVPQQPRMQFVDIALGERPVAFDELKQAFECFQMVLNDGGNDLRGTLPRF